MKATADDRSAKVTLPADDQILVVREFHAPPELVFRAWTTPALIKRWYAGRHGTVASVEVDLRVGGTWRYVLRTDASGESAFSGTYREINPGRQIVSTEVFEGVPEESVNTIGFIPIEEGTKLEILIQHASKANRDAVLKAGIEAGLGQILDSLAELLWAEQ
jgi:uncharacterized protein YndB with AHSA1/START domain